MRFGFVDFIDFVACDKTAVSEDMFVCRHGHSVAATGTRPIAAMGSWTFAAMGIWTFAAMGSWIFAAIGIWTLAEIVGLSPTSGIVGRWGRLCVGSVWQGGMLADRIPSRFSSGEDLAGVPQQNL